MKGTIAVKEAPVEVLEEDVDGLLPPQVHSVARPGEDDGKDALVGEEVEREAPATGATVTEVTYLEAVKWAASGAAEYAPARASLYTFCILQKSPIRSREICYTVTRQVARQNTAYIAR